MNIRLTTLGCKLNFAESSALAKALEARGHTIIHGHEPADVCIVNTCTVTDNADHKDRQAIHRLRRENPGAKMIVTGCYAALLKDKQASDNDRWTLSSADRKILQEIDLLRPKNREKYLGCHSHEDRTRCFIKVQDGCDYFCTYCTIPFARGRSRNIPIANIVEEARQALKEGAKELVLTGVNIGDFGKSTGESFLDLLRALDTLADTPYRLRMGSCEPNLLSDDIIDFVAHSQHITPHFHLPLQSGSNKVLEIMHRRYTRELFAERVEHIRRVLPEAFIGVDCMVGVRGETAECFEEYLAFISALPVSKLHVFTYSERANTHILRMDVEVVPMPERERRSQILHALSLEKEQAFERASKGRTHTVLWESKNQKGMMAGFTDNYIRVTCPFDAHKINTFETITL